MPVMDERDALEKTVTEAMNVVVLPEDFELSPLRDRICKLRNVLSARQKEATANLALKCTASKGAVLVA